MHAQLVGTGVVSATGKVMNIEQRPICLIYLVWSAQLTCGLLHELRALRNDPGPLFDRPLQPSPDPILLFHPSYAAW